MRMSLERFVEYLEKTRDLYEWSGGAGQTIRAHQPGGTTRQRVYILCPITAVYHSLFDEKIDVSYYEKAAKKLGLTTHSIAHIIRAADLMLLPTPKVSDRQLKKSVQLRNTMLEVLGLPIHLSR